MVFFTQLIYLNPGRETSFEAFESVALPLLGKYNGVLLLRLRPGENAKVAGTLESPYEIHVGSFPSETDYDRFLRDETRKQWIHLKEDAIREVLLIKGNRVG